MTMRRTHHPPAHSRDRWLLSYADFMTLLFAFFTTLYAASLVEGDDKASVAEGLRAALGGFTALPEPATAGSDVRLPSPPVVPPEVAEAARDRAQIAAARQAIERELADALAANELQLIEDRRGLVIAIPEAASFAAGRAEMSPTAMAIMHGLARALTTLPNAVRIEGHTDDVPIRTTQFSSNWDLSTARATRVVALLVDDGISPERLSAAGYSQFHPRAANTSPEARALNRRVDIVVLNASTTRAEEPGGAGR